MAKTYTLSWKTRGRLTGLAILLLSSLSAHPDALARTGTAPSAPTPALPGPAQIAAQAHLEAFLDTALDAHGTIHRDAALRIAGAEGASGDLIWITPFRTENQGFSGVTPSGHSLYFRRAQIVDWSLSGPDGRLYGNFGTRLFLTTLPADQAREIAAILTENPTPKEWAQ